MEAFDILKHVVHNLEKYHDSYTELHECRTARLMYMLGKAIGKDEEFCISLEKAGSLHDIGKLAIPSQILEKPTKLSGFEREAVELHVKVGYRVIKKIEHPLVKLASTIILTHHESYDGSGYPQGLQGEEIPLEGRICTICDVYDALASQRPYRSAYTHETIIYMMQDILPIGLTNKFDPNLLDAFISITDQIISFYDTTKNIKA